VSVCIDNLLTNQKVEVKRKRTFQIRVNAKDSGRGKGFDNVQLVAVAKEYFIIKFQCDNGTEPSVSKPMEML